MASCSSQLLASAASAVHGAAIPASVASSRVSGRRASAARLLVVCSKDSKTEQQSPVATASSWAESWRRQHATAAVAFAAAAAAVAGPVLIPDAAIAYIGGGPYGREVTRGQDLTGRDFSGLDLRGQDFKTSILRQANFAGSNLQGASFFDADLTGSDFTGADLTGADFSLTSATKVNFTNAILESISVTGNTSFKGSDITGADFTEVFFRSDQKAYLCKIASGTNPTTGNDTKDTLLC
eukprot:TRINITY_DN4351_c0_g1_i1.p1 TRINITY_DN4351_c0_g1~~TRINITY_DN4351_c0_g1_i1.p1  ORF type:complete len:267 (+),score=14.63 TRINITY_DN4351_c0_g1_i1:87-803(+)